MEKSRGSRNGGGVRHPLLTSRQMAAFRCMIELPVKERREVLDLVVFFELVERDDLKVQAIKHAIAGDIHS